ncbi:hypothetical protein A3B50_04565 [Candidatus Roizmanbacteria bacterium RIFCSPLOWO2_01_FULL_40_42]|uniref:Uncharacterized protein n=1 Tax=Candidatus Roizmanbacteria bacterium RIFCSPLOWO2_01_FULL_40_42 TaxID=1802066 RepID=A0A1F7J467_9BACT|nr:MAG: hypothetical protein A2779_00010 [Candidatus Roizmanbacteria bacterium RIFCSPHIGHO2_01_FULL_40_98]OGK28479.1 MAG: hypothetical protein A3C31_02785 [Candidatus Roizmanbacteria bacterium RIFCSPHIGHO2_02_FULL_40_53]OGK29370.1 MAG: hypothetical protein A2W49_00535 [Candidatus Roizmanbacteria bacterium RIFCSPHIGHO2_12_41_18]OGK36511.1 MAG: hypothetical protein A3E69_03000 [Candidatus Roizmanbacteria bacterium RIFCSPHIGHO2_12_FULL_40_130]OGK50396.1 MAG: hypothetical protein A3B50_04565 [Candi
MSIELQFSDRGKPIVQIELAKGDSEVFESRDGQRVYMEVSIGETMRVHEGWPPDPDKAPHFRYYQGPEINEFVEEKGIQRKNLFTAKPHWNGDPEEFRRISARRKSSSKTKLSDFFKNKSS